MEEGRNMILTTTSKLGLVVGKFSPLHKGHEYLIETALKQCDYLLILSYSNPEFKGYETEVRCKWLNALYGHRDNVLITVWPPVESMPLNTDPDDEQQLYLNFILDQIGYQPHYLFCSEPWGEACAKVIGAQAIIVDIDRHTVPISATEIRQDPWAHPSYLSDVVLASFVKRIAFLGGESTGKTTLASVLASLGGVYVAEYGRELYIEREGKLHESDLQTIARVQTLREDEQVVYAASKGCKYLLCDTSPLTTYGYSLWMFGHATQELKKLAKRKYDGVILCNTDTAFIQDGTRVSEAFRDRQQAWYEDEIAKMDCPVLKVTGSLEKRLLDSMYWIKELK